MDYKFFTIVKSPTKTLINLLKDNYIGTPGKSMLYRHSEVQKKMDHISDPYYVNLIKGNDILGTCCFCSRDTLNSEKSMSSFYLRYFTFKSFYRTKSKSVPKSKTKQSAVRREIIELLSGKGIGERGKGNFFHYAYVDPENSRSTLLCSEFGFVPVRKFSTIIFHRMNPKNKIEIEKISEAQVPEMKEKLIFFYKSYNMFSFENLFRSSDYFILRDNGGNIVAGAQATPENWRILELPGISGKIMLNLFSSVPILNKLIKKDYKFITLEGIYVKEGNEAYLEQLFEALLVRYNRNAAMLWLDRDTQLYATIKSINLGILNKLKKEITAHVICKFMDVKTDDEVVFRTNPAYISGTDLT